MLHKKKDNMNGSNNFTLKIPSTIYHEEDIQREFGNAYDQPKALEGHADDDDYTQPFRFLTGWYLIRDPRYHGSKGHPPQNEAEERLSLPEDGLFAESEDPTYRHVVVAGWLLPRDGEQKQQQHKQQRYRKRKSSAIIEPIFVHLRDVQYYAVDRSRLYRGYWVVTDSLGRSPEIQHALYWLQAPCSIRPAEIISTAPPLFNSDQDRDDPDDDFKNKRSNPQEYQEVTETGPSVKIRFRLSPSQQQLHLERRAQLSLLSNIMDFVVEEDEEIELQRKYKYRKRFVMKTYNQVYKELCQSEAFPNDEPFDKRLLGTYKSFVKQHLMGATPQWSEKSPFIKSLTTLKLEYPLSNDEIEEAAIAAEKRSQQHSWGEPISIEQAANTPLEAALLNAIQLEPDIEAKLAEAADSAEEALRKQGQLLEEEDGAGNDQSAEAAVDEMMEMTTIVTRRQSLSEEPPTEERHDDETNFSYTGRKRSSSKVRSKSIKSLRRGSSTHTDEKETSNKGLTTDEPAPPTENLLVEMVKNEEGFPSQASEAAFESEKPIASEQKETAAENAELHDEPGSNQNLESGRSELLPDFLPPNEAKADEKTETNENNLDSEHGLERSSKRKRLQHIKAQLNHSNGVAGEKTGDDLDHHNQETMKIASVLDSSKFEASISVDEKKEPDDRNHYRETKKRKPNNLQSEPFEKAVGSSAGRKKSGTDAPTSGDGIFSSDHAVQGLIRKYLKPQPTITDNYLSWPSVQKHNFSIINESRAQELLERLADGAFDTKPLESALVVIEALRQSCINKQNEVAKILFKARGLNSNKKAAWVIFDDWLQNAIAGIRHRMSSQEPVHNSTVLYLLEAIVNLMADCRVIKTPEHLRKLKRNIGIDWEQALDDVRTLSNELSNEVLSVAVQAARKKLDKITGDKVEGSVKRSNADGETPETICEQRSSLLSILKVADDSSPESLAGPIPKKHIAAKLHDDKMDKKTIGKIPANVKEIDQTTSITNSPPRLDESREERHKRLLQMAKEKDREAQERRRLSQRDSSTTKTKGKQSLALGDNVKSNGLGATTQRDAHCAPSPSEGVVLQNAIGNKEGRSRGDLEDYPLPSASSLHSLQGVGQGASDPAATSSPASQQEAAESIDQNELDNSDSVIPSETQSRATPLAVPFESRSKTVDLDYTTNNFAEATASAAKEKDQHNLGIVLKGVEKKSKKSSVQHARDDQSKSKLAESEMGAGKIPGDVIESNKTHALSPLVSVKEEIKVVPGETRIGLASTADAGVATNSIRSTEDASSHPTDISRRASKSLSSKRRARLVSGASTKSVSSKEKESGKVDLVAPKAPRSDTKTPQYHIRGDLHETYAELIKKALRAYQVANVAHSAK